jgi:sugar phosphate isomerase/epimerase
MHTAICHYSFNRTWTSAGWTCLDLAKVVASFDVEGIDFHAELLGDRSSAAQRIRTALKGTGLKLAGLSLSNDFNQDTAEALRDQIDSAVAWVRVASELNAPVSRIFGGSVHERGGLSSREVALRRITDALGAVAAEAEHAGVVLALENHGGLPCTGAEQVRIIEAVGSPFLRATIDMGNYMQCGQEGHAGTREAARFAAYVHFKDYRRTGGPGGTLEACTPGQGDVDHERCLRELAAAGYEGYVALEYEGVEDESSAVRTSVGYMKRLLDRLAEEP